MSVKHPNKLNSNDLKFHTIFDDAELLQQSYTIN